MYILPAGRDAIRNLVISKNTYVLQILSFPQRETRIA